MKYDYIIVGQGLAGTIVSLELLERGKKVLLIDDGSRKSASRVGAGLFNPFTGPRMAFSWHASALFPFIMNYYASLQDKLKARFFYPRGIYRPFQNIEEQNDFIGKSAVGQYRKFIGKINHASKYGEIIDDRFGGVLFNYSGYLDMAQLLTSSLNYFQDKLDYCREKFVYEELEILPNEIRYKNHRSFRLILCTGYKAGSQPYFSWLPLVPLKGEILWIKPEQEIETIFSKGCFIIPRNDGICMAGSTYDRKDQTLAATENGRKEITVKLNSLLKIQYKIVGQDIGIRPATINRRPLLGVHPKWSNLILFNGLGTKGVTLAPFFGNQLINFLETSGKLDAEVDINRYNSLYYTSILEAKR